MLFPALPGVQIVDISEDGQKDPINTAVEFIDQVLLGHKDKTPETETTKHHRFLHSAKIRCAIFCAPVAAAEPRSFIPGIAELDFIMRPDNIGASLYYDIAAPPPKAA